MERKEDPVSATQPPRIPWWSIVIRLTAAAVILGVGVGIALYLYHAKPQAKKRPPSKWVPLVQVQPLVPTRYHVIIKAMGTVIPARQISLQAQVSGEVVELHPEFTEGGFLQKGDEILRLDDVDYRLALAQKQSDLVTSRYNLELELGRQTVAQREWTLLKGGLGAEDSDDSLALRKPQLKKAEADVNAAESSLQKAELDLQRTRITAPFNSIVRSKSAEIGSQVSTSAVIAELVGIDAYWVQTSVPVDRLKWIRIPRQKGEAGSAAKIRYAGGSEISGTVVRLMGDLDPEGRMAKVLVAVADPLRRRSNDPDALPLLIGEFVQVEIDGKYLDGVFLIPRTALRDNHEVWLVGPGETLLIRNVEPIWKGETTVVVRDSLQAGDRLIVSDMSAPVNGMDVRVQGSASAEPGPRQGAERDSHKKGT